MPKTVTPKSRRILRLPGVIDKTGLGRDSIYRGGREGWFPKPIKLSERASGWFEDEIDACLEQRAAARDAGLKAAQKVKTYD
jgi:prophage regulatory protein